MSSLAFSRSPQFPPSSLQKIHRHTENLSFPLSFQPHERIQPTSSFFEKSGVNDESKGFKRSRRLGLGLGLAMGVGVGVGVEIVI